MAGKGGYSMNPVRYWMRIVIAANPKKMPRTPKQAINIFVANATVLLIANLIPLVSHITIILLPLELGMIVFLGTLVLMLAMLISIFGRMRRVTAWRHKVLEKDKPVE